MTLLVATAAFTLLAGIALWGWGRAACRVFRQAPLPVALTIAAGLAAVLFVGGAIIAAHLAHPRVFDLIIVAGVALAALGLRETRRAGGFAVPRAALAVGAIVLGAGAFVAWHLLPPAAVNIYDDLEKYFAQPVRLLALGWFPPNPVATLGADSLGGQAFLQAFVLAHFPIAYIGAVDSYFCLLLCVALAGTALPAGGRIAGAVVAALAVIVIPPQVVNTSAVFTGAALLMAAIFLGAQPSRPEAALPSAPLLGLVFAAVIALKVTLGIFVATQLGLLAVVGLALGRASLKWIFATALWTAGFLLPWVIIHLPLYLLPVQPAPADPAVFTHEASLLFSPTPLNYGVAPLPFTVVALVALGAAVVFASSRRHGALSLATATFVATGFAVALGYFLLIGPLSATIAGQAMSLRYCSPLFIAAIPALLRLAEFAGPNPGGRWVRLIALLAGLVVLVVFLPAAAKRARLIAGQQLDLAYFPAEDTTGARARYLDYNRDVLTGGVRQKLAQVQARVPAGESLGAWVSAPFWFDFNRNRVFCTDPAGLGLRWSRLPDDVHYFILEYEGFAVRYESEIASHLTDPGRTDRVFARRTLDFLADLKERVRTGRARVDYDDGQYVLLQFVP